MQDDTTIVQTEECEQDQQNDVKLMFSDEDERDQQLGFKSYDYEQHSLNTETFNYGDEAGQPYDGDEAR